MTKHAFAICEQQRRRSAEDGFSRDVAHLTTITTISITLVLPKDVIISPESSYFTPAVHVGQTQN